MKLLGRRVIEVEGIQGEPDHLEFGTKHVIRQPVTIRPQFDANGKVVFRMTVKDEDQ